MDKINVGLIGYGYWGPNLARNISEIPEFNLKYISDLSESKQNIIKTKYPHVTVTRDYNQILNDKDIKAVVIATPISTHFPIIMDCLKHNKDILVEKPLSVNRKQSAKIKELVLKNKNILLVSHTFLYSPSVMKMKEIIDSKQLGDIFCIDSSRVNLGLLQPDVDVVWDLGPHDLSVILYWMQKMPAAVSCIGQAFIQPNIQEVAYITLYWSNKTIAHIHLSWLSPAKLRRMVVIGNKKMVVYDDIAPDEKIKIYDKGVGIVKEPESFGEFQLIYRSGDISSPKIESAEPLKLECLDFLNSIKTRKQPKSDVYFGEKIVKLLELADLSMKHKGKIIPVQ